MKDNFFKYGFVRERMVISMNQNELRKEINGGRLERQFYVLYGDEKKGYDRYDEVLALHEKWYGEREGMALFSVPGRTEIGGNHTDHQQGRVLAGAVDLDIIAAVSPNDKNIIRVHSKGYNENLIDLTDLSPKAAETNHSASLVRGVAFRMRELGCKVSGFDAATISNVLVGSGLSSSAAFEVMIATIINLMFNDGKLSAVELAKVAQYAEREYFGKPSGLMDQTACSVGGCVEIDFENPTEPKINEIEFDLEANGYKLVIVNTGASHSDLTDDYGSVPTDMKKVAAFFNEGVLRSVDENKFYKDLLKVRAEVGDKALLRAIHFFDENNRVPFMAKALKENDITSFFKYVKASGKSSFERLQNIYSDKNPNEQSIALALALSERILGEDGVCRVHGGGFAGTIQAYVKEDKLSSYTAEMEKIFGEGSCHALNIRSVGGEQVF